MRNSPFCNGLAVHGNRDTLELDARKRNWLQAHGWAVLTFWGCTILKDPGRCAREVADVHAGRVLADALCGRTMVRGVMP